MKYCGVIAAALSFVAGVGGCDSIRPVGMPRASDPKVAPLYVDFSARRWQVDSYTSFIRVRRDGKTVDLIQCGGGLAVLP